NADLASALRDRVCDRAIETDDSQHERDGCEGAEERERESRRGEGVVDVVVGDARPTSDDCRLDAVDRVANDRFAISRHRREANEMDWRWRTDHRHTVNLIILKRASRAGKSRVIGDANDRRPIAGRRCADLDERIETNVSSNDVAVW